MANDKVRAEYTQRGDDRRKQERRKAQVPFQGPERRTGDRRSIADRRAGL